MDSGRSLRVLLGGAVMEPDWQGGEPVFLDLLRRGLTEQGVTVLPEGSRRSFAELAALSVMPFDAEPMRMTHYRDRLRALRPDIVLMGFDFDCSLVLAARQEGIPCVVSVQIYWPTCPVGTRYIEGQGVCTEAAPLKCVRHISRIGVSPNLQMPVSHFPAPLAVIMYAKRWMRTSALNHADALVANSEFEGQVLRQGGYTNVHVIHNGVDPAQFPATPWSGPTKTVLYPVARSRQERKGYAHFVEMAKAIRAQLPEVRFQILNDPGDDLVDGTPYLSRADLAATLRSSYLAVVPGLWDEPFGFVAAEAMSSGRPVVMYDGGGSAELFENGRSGVLVPRGDVGALTRAVLALLRDEAAAREIGAAARARIEDRFRYDVMAQRFLSLMNGVLDGRSRPAPSN